MNKFHGLAFLMGITILCVTGFQLYWLKQNYAREKNTLAIKSEVAFRETIEHLQLSKLKLDGVWSDSTHKGNVKIFMKEGNGEKMNIRLSPKTEVITTLNVLRKKLKDSTKKDTATKTGMIISVDNNTISYSNDSLQPPHRSLPDVNRDHIFQMLYGVDSLQDSLKLKDINVAYAATMKQQKLNVPFSIARLDKPSSDQPSFNEVTVGFAKPIAYKLTLGNSVPYLIKQIRQPIIFSILLLGITILSFVLLYRTLLKQRRLAVLKNDFISNITHELKTPIATVGVAIEALKNFNAIHDQQKTQEYLDISQNELQRLNLLVDKVLKLSMFEKKDIELKKEVFDLRQLAEEVMNSMKLQFEKHGAKLNLVTEGDSFSIDADKLHITSVIYNLLDNALKYSKENPEIEVKLKSHTQHVSLSVKDNGIGIPPEYKGKVFEKFFRVPTGDRHNIKGYGLGLSYVSEIARRHHGFIEVESEPAKGSIFTVHIPYKEEPVIQFDEHRKSIKKVIRIGR
ncbi:MAG: HAMP domain-containing sensor histidine kinase [Chitinophagaceae bacterium]